MYQYPGEGDSLSLSLFDFPVAGYSIPANEDSFYLSNGNLYWDNPLVAGKYAVGVKTKEWKLVNNPVYDVARILTSTITKGFTIIVDSADVITTIPDVGITTILSVYPNPTSRQVNVDCIGCGEVETIMVHSVVGQLMYKIALSVSSRRLKHSFEVNNWPTGIYFVAIETEKGRLVRKLVVE